MVINMEFRCSRSYATALLKDVQLRKLMMQRELNMKVYTPVKDGSEEDSEEGSMGIEGGEPRDSGVSLVEGPRDEDIFGE